MNASLTQSRLPSIWFVLSLLLTMLSVSERTMGQDSGSQKKSSIEAYVHRPDPSYSWKVAKELPSQNGISVSVIDMVSQTWRTKEEVNRPEWRHWLVVARPENLRSDKAFLMIGGGSNNDDAPNSVNPMIAQIAAATGTMVAELRMVPNQPLIFHNDGETRTEDDLIGYTWDQYLKTGDANWVARNPMVKSAVRAMDTMTAFAKSKQQKVDRFVVAGGSKRGWTTWLTGAFDDRVIGIIPIVIDVLNADQSMRHHFAAYGFWAPAIGNYVQHKIMERMDHPRLKEIYELVDPYYHLDRLQMPKLILNGSGDQFFLPDSSQFYWDDLQGPKFLRYVANGDHGMGGTDATETVLAFYSLLVNEQPIPKIEWSQTDGTIQVNSQTKPVSAVLWKAHNPIARDFRIETLGRKYISQPLETREQGVYSGRVDSPTSGWTAYFAELTFDVGLKVPLKLTTNVYVTPNTLPFAGKDPSKPGTVTIVCEAMDAATGKLLTKVIPQVAKSAKIQAAQMKTRRSEETIYVNFKPIDSDAAAVVGQIAGWLEKQGCKNLRYQLESGSDITLPPALAPASEPAAVSTE